MSSASCSESRSRAAALASLFHHRWAVPILAELERGAAGGRFAALRRRLGVGREVLRRTLAALEERGLAHGNPGYGHPLRPEYVATEAGRSAGAWSVRFVRLIDGLGIEDAALRKWSMPVVLVVGAGNHRFSEIKQALPGITARALTIALKDLGEARLVDRRVTDAHPPRVDYRLSAAGRRLARLARNLPLGTKALPE